MKSLPFLLRSVLSASLLILIIFTACKKEDHHPTAKGSLQYADGGCRAYTVHGTYLNGVAAGTDTNYVQISVAVTSPGSYQITTDKQNGVTFSASGTFMDTGVNLVRLKSNGTFINPVTTNFNVSFDNTFCGFTVKALDSTGFATPDNSWRFTAGGHVYQGPGSGTYYAAPFFLGDGFTFVGSMASFSDTSLTVDFAWYVGLDSTGAHVTSLGNTDFHFTTSRFATGPKITFEATPQTASAVIYVRKQTWSTGIWTFTGTALDASNHVVPITDGVFKATHYNYVNQE